jgi:DNA-damage-inducible protein J
MATTSMIHVRIDEQVKAQANATLAAMGLSMSDAVRVFLTRVAAEQRLPFALEAPNAETRAAMAEADAIARQRHARFTTADALFDELEAASRE